MSQKPVTDVSVTYNVALVSVGNLQNDMNLISNIFKKLAEAKINIDMISLSSPYAGNINLSFSMPSSDIVIAISTLNEFKTYVPELGIDVDSDNTKISVYGKEMKNIPGVAANLFTIFSQNSIDVKLITTSEVDISLLIYEKDVDRAVEAINKEFNL